MSTVYSPNQVFRLTKRRFSDKLSGIGAAKFGNRWNSKGVEMIYTSSSRALAMAEVLVHLPPRLVPKDYMMMTIEIPTSSLAILPIENLPKEWDSLPPIKSTQQLGDQFCEANEALLLKVPSAVVKGDFNYLINPHHKDFGKLSIVEVTDFKFDERIV